MKLHSETQRCSDLFDQLNELLKAEEDQTVSCSALSLLMFNYVMRQDDEEEAARALIAVLEAMLVSFDHGVGPVKRTTH